MKREAKLSKAKYILVKTSSHFHEKWRVCSFPENILLGGHLSKCIFAEGRRLDTTPRFWKLWKCRKSWITKIYNFVRPNCQTWGPQSWAMCFRSFLSSQFFPNCHLEHFVFLVGTVFSKIPSTTHVSYYDYYESKNELIGVASGSFSQKWIRQSGNEILTSRRSKDHFEGILWWRDFLIMAKNAQMISYSQFIKK